MTKKTTYILIILIPFVCNSQGIKIDKYTVNINDTNKILEVYNINNKNYISISQLTYLFKNKENKTNQNKIDLGFAKFSFLPSSYFAKVQMKNREIIQQYNLPVINYNNETLIPLHSFVYSLDSLNIYQVQIEKKQIILNSYTKVVEKQANTKIIPPGYKIPENLDRPILQELLKEK